MTTTARTIVVYAKDREGFPLVGADFVATIGGQDVSVTNSNGQATFRIQGAAAPIPVTVTYDGRSRTVTLAATATSLNIKFDDVVTRSSLMSFFTERVALFAGLLLWVVALVLAFTFSHPTALQAQLIRSTFALGAGGIASVTPGLLNVKLAAGKRFSIAAAGALAVYVITFFFAPAAGQ